MNGDFGWLELPGGSDCHQTGVFYARSLGWQVEDDGQTVWFREPSGRLGGAFRGDLAPGGPGPILYVSVGDADTALRRIRECGGIVVQERTMIAPGFGYRAVFQDPAGTTMGLFEPAS